MAYATFSEMVFGAWEFAHEDDMFRFFNQALKSLRLYAKERQRGMVESLTCYLNNVVKRKDVEETLEEKCRELAGLLRDTMQANQIESSIPMATRLLEKKATAKKKRNRLWVQKAGEMSVSISTQELMLITFTSHFRR